MKSHPSLPRPPTSLRQAGVSRTPAATPRQRPRAREPLTRLSPIMIWNIFLLSFFWHRYWYRVESLILKTTIPLIMKYTIIKMTDRSRTFHPLTLFSILIRYPIHSKTLWLFQKFWIIYDSLWTCRSVSSVSISHPIRTIDICDFDTGCHNLLLVTWIFKSLWFINFEVYIITSSCHISWSVTPFSLDTSKFFFFPQWCFVLIIHT